jgi:hypothetical protein
LSKPYDKILAIDFETRWSSKEYTLSKMTTEEYIRDERFTAFGCCFHEYGSDGPIEWVRGEYLPAFLADIDWGRTAVLAHNAQFDISILEWRYGIRPAFIFDTLSMARALRGVEVGNSLARLAIAFNLPEKGRAVHSTDGLSELDAEISFELGEYCKHDVFLCEQIFGRLVEGYPVKELRLIDMTLKMYTRPMLVLDEEMLMDALVEEKEKREELLQKCGVDEAALASNPQFAAILERLGVPPPQKVSKTTGKQTLALAKNDAMFQALLNSDNEDVALLCETRLKVKSTTERTRAQRFLDIASRGTLPVPLNYYGALSGRWTASKGSAINMQNLKRGSFLRKAIMAPEGHQLVVGDLGQIEPRVLAWLADYDDLMGIFRSGGDPYAQFGAQMFNTPGLTKDSHPDLRQSAKSALLGCFGADTPVLTPRGWVPIIQVQATDTVWDGEEWVMHQGIVPQGEKEVLTALGISATSDHEILTGHGWVEWCAALASPSLLKLALLRASLLASVGSDAPTGQNGKASLSTNLRCAALADGRGLLSEPISEVGAPHAATTVQKRRRQQHECSPQATKQSVQTGITVTDCLIESARSLFAVPTQTVQSIQTMAGAVSRYIQHGLQTASSFCATLLGWMAGTNQSYSLIASTTNAATVRAISGSALAASTCQTSAASAHEKWKRSGNGSAFLKQRMQTYDIAYAGPRNRYTILTDAGPLIVHNCGYGMGWASFAAQLLTGFLGAKPVMYDKEFAKRAGVSYARANKFIGSAENIRKMEEIPHTCSEQELLIHCFAAKAIIDKYRKTAWPVVTFWNLCNNLIEDSLYGGKEYVHKCVTFRKGEIVLPSGMSLLYPDLQHSVDEQGRLQWTYGPDRVKLYAGKIVNNVTQGVARCVMTDGMLRVARRYPVVGTVHDEQIVCVPDADVDFAKTWVLEQMTVEPKYMPGIPLAADGGAHRRYGLAKN